MSNEANPAPDQLSDESLESVSGGVKAPREALIKPPIGLDPPITILPLPIEEPVILPAPGHPTQI